MTARSERFPGSSGLWPGRAGKTSLAQAQAEVTATRPPAALTGIGNILQEAREARGLTHAIAERDTHIPRHHLQALEEERFDAFHAPVYVRGFLRSYSQYLGLDSSTLLALLPADRPAEDDRLPSLNRLGRPRGPSEAARARRDPTERDAPALAEAPLERPSPPRRDPWDDDESGRMRFAIDHPATATARPRPRLDPLGRLGWPERPSEAAETPFHLPAIETETAAGEPAPAVPPRRERWDRPLGQRRPPRRTAMTWPSLLPADVRPLFGQRPILVAAGVGCGLLVLLIAQLIVSGDATPTVLPNLVSPAAASTTNVTPEPTPVQSTAHGAMPEVRGVDPNSALTNLQNSGVVPVVIDQSAGDTKAKQVMGQFPAAGTSLDSQTTVVLVLGAPR